MAKKSGYLERIEKAKKDTFFSTRFVEAMNVIYSEYADIWNGDTKDVEYSKSSMDRALRQIFGDYFEPLEVRYGHR